LPRRLCVKFKNIVQGFVPVLFFSFLFFYENEKNDKISFHQSHEASFKIPIPAFQGKHNTSFDGVSCVRNEYEVAFFHFLFLAVQIQIVRYLKQN